MMLLGSYSSHNSKENMLKDRNLTGYICRLATASIEEHDTLCADKLLYCPYYVALVYLFDAKMDFLDTLTNILIYVICVIRI